MKYAIGVDLGGTGIKYGLLGQNGELIYEEIMPTEADKGAEVVIQNLISAVNNAKQFAESKKIVPVGVGIGTPGIVDRTNRIVLGGADNIKSWSNVPLSEKIEETCQLPVFINNDANLMGLGEQTFGGAKDCTDVLFITVGTGIGGAIIINGKLFGGYDNRGTELGHIPLFADGIPCSCGSIGCWEAYASTNALIQQFKTLCEQSGISFDEKITGKLITKLYQQSHPVAVLALDNHCRYLAHGIAGLVNIFSPQKIVIGGGISGSGSFYIQNIKKYFDKYVMPDCAVNTEICAATLGNHAGLSGAAQWAFLNIQGRTN